MRIVPSLLIALALIFGVSAGATLIASADSPKEVKGAAKEKGEEAGEKADEAEEKAEKKAKSAAEAQKAKAKAARATRKERLLKVEEKRHAARVKEIEARRARVIALHEKQLRNIDGAAVREQARYDKRVEQINAK
jgi:hypothetical protein